MTRNPPPKGRAIERDRRELLTHAAQLFALCGLAIAQPLFAVLGEEPTYFVAHGVEGFDLVLFGLVVVVVPPLVLFGVLLVAWAASPRAERVLVTSLVGFLVAVAAVGAIDRSARLSDAAYIVLMIVVGAAAGFVYARWRPARIFATFLCVAPLLFLGAFLFISPASALLETGEPELLRPQGTPTPVVLVVFDEQPLGALVDREGKIDRTRFPNFGRLADIATWYPRATTTSLSTAMAVPTILSGTTESSETPPTDESFPRSLFTMLGRSHRVRGDELLTRICPPTVCPVAAQREGRIAEDQGDLGHDTLVAYLHSVLPDGLAADWLPPIGARWGGFDDETSEAAHAPAAERIPPAGHVERRFSSFLRSLELRAGGTTLAYHHEGLPHIPWRYFGDGREYDSVDRGFGIDEDLRWYDDEQLMDTMAQRLLLQSGYVDQLVGRLLDTLERTGELDRSLVIITADHGIGLEAGKGIRGPVTGRGPSSHAVQAVPLFIKYPGQQVGAVDDRPAQLTDVLPTIADVLDIELPSDWEIEGRSLLAAPRAHSAREFMGRKLTSEVDPSIFSARIRDAVVELPGRTDFVAVAPYGTLVGRAVADLVGEPLTDARIQLARPGAFDDVDPSGLLPALIVADVEGVAEGAWLAFAIDGVIAGTGPVFERDGLRVSALLDPTAIRAGRNDLRAYVIQAEGTALREVEIGRP